MYFTLRASLRLFKFIPDKFVATHLLQRGVSLRAIQTHLGHASPITTARYTRMTEEVTQNSALMINDMLSLLNIT